MRLAMICACLVVVCLSAHAAPGVRSAASRPHEDAAVELKEPPLELFVDVEGKRFEARLGQPVEIEIGGKKARLTVNAGPSRTLRVAGVEFRYPSSGMFSVDASDPKMTLWVIRDGNDSVFLIRYADKIEPRVALQQTLDGMSGQYDKQSVKKSPTTIKLGNQKLEGVRLTIRMGAQRIDQSFYSIDTGRSTVVLIIQDPGPLPGESVREVGPLPGMLQQTFRILK
ncbi:MAG: hypothetical protein GX616_12060 [Planctomycetes bacterium]|nr:hypothetical protein [Planctomycetota bacterium]